MATIPLYGLFKYNYTSGKIVGRLPLVFHALAYLTHNLTFYGTDFKKTTHGSL